MAEYNRIKDTTLSAFFSKLKAFFWHKTDVVNVPLADVATTGDYNDLINKPSGGGGVPPLVMTISSNNSKFNTIGFCPLSQYVTARIVEFSVEGVTLDAVEITGITDNTFYESAEQDPVTGAWGYTFGPGDTGLYYIEAKVYGENSEDTAYTGLLYVLEG